MSSLVLHPTLDEQETDSLKYRDCVTDESLRALLATVGLRLESYRHLHDSEGSIHTIYFVDASLLHDPQIQRLVLRVGNPHKFWKQRKTEGEIAMMGIVKENLPSIPVPAIYSYSSHAEESILGCEYILAQRVTGVTLSSLYDQKLISDSLAESVRNQLADFVRSLHSIDVKKTFDWEQIGCSDLHLKLKPWLGDRYPLGPFDSYAQLLRDHAEYVIAALPTSESRESVPVESVITALREYLRQVEVYEKRNEQFRLQICHHDLNASNIMVDPLTEMVTGIIDWEHASCGIPDFEWETLSSLSDELGAEKWFEALAERGITKPEGFDYRQDLFSVIDAAMWLCFYSSSWYREEPTLDAKRKRMQEGFQNAFAELQGALSKLGISLESSSSLECNSVGGDGKGTCSLPACTA